MAGLGSVGFFGKLPGTGDFVQRRLAPAFVTAWDTAFEVAVDGARTACGGNWDALWRAAPIWRFALNAGACGDAACVGVIGPSVDRVGRRFPMVLAHPVDAAAAMHAIVAGADGWYSSLERVCAMACKGGAVSADDFDAAVSALADPAAWLDETRARLPMAASGADGWPVPWLQASGDQQLANAWADIGGLDRACLWWTRGTATFVPALCVTRGLPGAETYAGFITSVHAAAASAAPLAPTASPPGADLLDDLLNGYSDDTIPGAIARTPAPAPAVRAPDAVAEFASGEPVADSSDVTVVPSPTVANTPADAGEAEAAVAEAPLCLQQDSATLIAADNEVDDPRCVATRRVADALADGAWSDPEQARQRLLAVHPELHARHEDLIDPIPENCAVIAAWLQEGHARVLRIGTATAWHARHGQLRPLFADAVGPVADEVDTVRPDDLLGAPAATVAALPGLGAAAEPACEETSCEVEAGDRVILLATDTLVRVSAASLAASLAGVPTAEVCGRIAESAGLAMDGATWPMAVIEVGT